MLDGQPVFRDRMKAIGVSDAFQLASPMDSLLILATNPCFIRQVGANALAQLTAACAAVNAKLYLRLRNIFWHWRDIQAERAYRFSLRGPRTTPP